jgi:hypothetical protein
MEGETQKSIWNLDNIELSILFEIKVKIITALDSWNLEGAYWELRNLRRELDAKIGRVKERFEGITLEEDRKEKEEKKSKSSSEKEEVDKKLKELEKTRNIYNSNDKKTEKDKSEYYLALEELYMFLCFLMKKHGLYFREGEDNRMAVLRR